MSKNPVTNNSQQFRDGGNPYMQHLPVWRRIPYPRVCAEVPPKTPKFTIG